MAQGIFHGKKSAISIKPVFSWSRRMRRRHASTPMPCSGSSHASQKTTLATPIWTNSWKFSQDISIHISQSQAPPEVLTAPYILQRIKGHLFTCVTTTGLSEQARIKRVSTCVESLRVILHRFTSGPAPSISRTWTKCHYEHTCKV